MVVGSPTMDLLEAVDSLLGDCERYFSNADRSMAENLIVRSKLRPIQLVDCSIPCIIFAVLPASPRSKESSNPRIELIVTWSRRIKFSDPFGSAFGKER